MNLIDSKKALAALAATASILPNIAKADSPAESIVIGYKYHNYSEADLSKEKLSAGSAQRYDIDVNQFQLLLPMAGKYQLNIDYQTETMSGASPQYTKKSPNGSIVQVMSGASIKDTRDDIKVSFSAYSDNSTTTFGLANSNEDDYTANSVFAAYSQTTADKMQTYGISVDYSDDKVDPVDKDRTPARVEEQDKNSLSVMLSTTQTINRNMIWQVSGGFIEKDGYLSDPYKLVSIVDESEPTGLNTFGDERPDNRFAWVVTSSTRNYIEGANAAAHVDYRYYQDDWDLSSHTIEFKWLQTIAKDWRLIPSFRYYTQSATDFYQSYYESDQPAQKYYSTDYRLSSYGAITLGLKVETKIDDWLVNLGYESYRSDGSYGLESDNQDNPGLVDFDILSVGFYYSFN